MLKLGKKTIWIIVLLLVCGLVFSGEVMAGKVGGAGGGDQAGDQAGDSDPDPDPVPEPVVAAVEQIKDGLLPDEPDAAGFRDDSDLYIDELDELDDVEYDSVVVDAAEYDLAGAEPNDEKEEGDFATDVFESEMATVSPEFDW